jgi:hypothetical protein
MHVKSARAPRKDASLMVGILDDLLDRDQPRQGFVDLGNPRFEVVGEDLPPRASGPCVVH